MVHCSGTDRKHAACLSFKPSALHNSWLHFTRLARNTNSLCPGIVPAALEDALKKQAAAGRRARVLYTVPHGQNPTGATMSMQRKRDVYAVCCAHDVIILEDDAYAYLQFPQRTSDPCPGAHALPQHSRLSCTVHSNVTHSLPSRESTSLNPAVHESACT